MMEPKSDVEDSTLIHSDPIIEVIGDFGRWQFLAFLAIGLLYIPNAWSVIVIAFLNAKTDYWCSVPEHLQGEVTIAEWKSMSGQGESRCSIFNVTEGNRFGQSGPKIPCESFTFDTDTFDSTLTSEWSLVCSDGYKVNLAQSVYFFGQMSGIVICGVMSDKFGRKTLFIPLSCLMGIFGILGSIVDSYEGFLVLRFLIALTKMGSYESMFAYLLETSGGQWTSILSQGFFLWWVFAWITLAPMAFYLPNWRYLHGLTCAPALLSLVLIWLLPESPKWLLATGNRHKAERVTRKIAKVNGNSDRIQPGWILSLTENFGKQSKGNVWDIWRYPELRQKSLILFVCWFILSLTYFGLSFNSANLGGDLFVNHIIGGLMEIPGYCGAMLFMNWVGRKWTLAGSLSFCGLVLLSITAVPPKEEWLVLTLAFLGKASISMAFGAIYTVTAETFPTTIRTTGIACGSFWGRLGALVAPWVALLGDYHLYLPVIIYGFLAIGAGLFAMLLPETMGIKLPDTFEESEMSSIGLPCSRSRSRDLTTSESI